MFYFYCVVIFSALLTPSICQSRGGPRCGGTLNATFQARVLTSPNYPRNHPNNLNCIWTINPAENNRSIKFSITSLNTESCCDYVEVSDGTVVIGRYAGRSTVVIPIISTHLLRIRFRADSSVTRTGFRAIYQEVNNCGRRLNATSTLQYISTPFYPNPHPPVLDCYWIIVSGFSRKVELTFLEGATDSCCDYVQVFDNTRSLGQLKGNITQRTFTVQNQISVYFHSDSSREHDGFLASFREFQCGGNYQILDDALAVVTSPNYPNASDHNLNCNYTFQSDPGYRIELTITVDTELCCDYVDVFEGGKKIGRLNGQIPKSVIVSTGSSLRLYFHTDGSVSSKGFTATYQRFLPGCGSTYLAKIGIQNQKYIESPLYPNLYPNNQRCDWTFTAPTGANIVLDILDFVTETCCDYVEIFDGLVSVGRLQGLITHKFSLVTTTNNMRVHFSSDDSTQKRGFRAGFRQTNNCGSELFASGLQRSFRTPQYPRDYHDNLDCMWVITTGDGTRVRLNISKGETEQYHDYIQVLDGLVPSAKISGVLKTQVFTSTGRTLRVYFHSDQSATRTGFIAFYNKTCNSYLNVTSQPQFLLSPNYPETTPHNFKCNYYLQAPLVRQRIKVTVQSFQTERCCDYLLVFENGSQTRRFVGTVPRNTTYYSSSNEVRLFYSTDGSVSSAGFELTYQLV